MKKVLCFLFILSIGACKEPGTIWPRIHEPPSKEVWKCQMIGTVAPHDDPIWHPNGQIIGYNHNPVKTIRNYLDFNKQQQQDVISDEAASGFWLVNSDGTNPHQILTCNLLTPAWSPDGKWIAFVDQGNIYKMPFDGKRFDTSAVVQLTFDKTDSFPAWSPDGQWIAYDSNTDPNNAMHYIWKMRSDGSGKTPLAIATQEGETRMPSWNKDFTIVYQKYKRYDETDQPEIFAMDANGQNNKRLTNNDETELYPQFSPDGQFLAYTAYATGKSEELYLVDRQEDNSKKLSDSGALKFSWSPSGEEIVYLSHKYGQIDEKIGALWVINVKTMVRRQLTFNKFTLIK